MIFHTQGDTKMRNNIVFIIDAQNDFLAYRDGVPYSEKVGGVSRLAALPVPGGVEDLDRLTTFIDSDARGEGIDHIVYTLDTHEPNLLDRHIGHGKYWVNARGEHPAPFTQITLACVKNRTWEPHNSALYNGALEYLEKVGVQMIWPEHCIDRSWGHRLFRSLHEAIARWEARNGGKRAHFVRKGMYNHSEQYGVFEAAVPNPERPTTLYNHSLLNVLKGGTKVFVGGEALLHCVGSSLRQAFSKLGPEDIAKWTLVTDCTSPVPVGDYVMDSAAFLNEMRALGMKTALSAP